jgi:hypothetical protein
MPRGAKDVTDTFTMPKLTPQQWIRLLFRTGPEKLGYICANELYTVHELKKRLGVSDTWLRRARTKGLHFSRVSNTGIEVVSGADVMAILKEHKNLCSEE